MHKSRKKSFNWYGTRQHFSIRKYHFGAASVLLGLSLAMNAGAQAISAQEASVSSSPDSSVTTEPPVTDTSIVLTEPSTAAISTTTEAVSPVERTATINYIVQYVLEDGTVVYAVVKSTSVTTLETLAKANLEVTAELPYAYELAAEQLATQTVEVTENAENIVTVKVAKKVEAQTSQTLAETSEETPGLATATAKKTEDVATTTATVSETVKTPATVEEAKVVLEQVVSEAEVLANEATRLVVASDSDNAALKAAATATKLTATEATEVLNNTKATLEAVNAQIDAVRTNVEALALELRKFYPNGNIEVILATLDLSKAKIGDSTGEQLASGPTVTAPLTDAAGQAVTSATSSTVTATNQEGYYTFHYAPLDAYYNPIQRVSYRGQEYPGSYFRTSTNADPVTNGILVELVDANHTVIETHKINSGESASFTSYQATSGVNQPIVVTYGNATQDENVAGTLSYTFDTNSIVVGTLIPRPKTYTTYYKVQGTEEVLGTYTTVTLPGLTVTPSGKREFSGYSYVEKTEVTTQYPEGQGASYVDVSRSVGIVQGKTVVTVVDDSGTIIKDFYIVDPNISDDVRSYTSTDATGFIHIFRTSAIPMNANNTNTFLNPELLNSTFEIYRLPGSHTFKRIGDGTRVTTAEELDLTLGNFEIVLRRDVEHGELTSVIVTMVSSDLTRVRTNFIRRGFAHEYYTIPNDPKDYQWELILTGEAGDSNVTPMVDQTRNGRGKTQYPILDAEGNLQPRLIPYFGINQSFRINNPNTIDNKTELTYWYTAIPQRAQIIYQTDKGVQLDDIDEELGNPGETIAYSTAARIAAYEKAGYELVSDGGPQSGQDAKFDYTNDDATDPSQKFYVVLKERVVEIPKDSVPNQPVDPQDPNSPNWPEGVDIVTYTEEVNRTITYVDEQGQPVAQTFKDTVNFERKAYVNLVTGETTYDEWTAVNQDNVLDGNPLPEVAGYSVKEATKAGAAVTPTSTTVYAQVTAETADIVEQVVYTQDTQAAKITLYTVDAKGENKTEYATVNETGKHTETVATPTTEGELVKLKRLGYDVVNKVADDFLDSAKTYDNVKDTDGQPSQTYEIIVKERVVDIPNDAIPGQPVNPTDPNSPNWPAGVDQLKLTEEVTRTITYVDEAGKEVAASFTTTVNFTRTAQVNLVTGEITYGEWTATNQDSTLEGNPLPTVTDHHVISATKDGGDVLPATTTIDTPVTAESADIVEKVVYAKDTGSVIIKYKDTDGNTLQEPVVDEDNVLVGTTYDTKDEGNKPAEIVTKNGSKYVLVPAKTEGAETGPVTKEDTIVTYVYQKIANWIPVIPGVPADQRPKTEYPFDPTNPDAPIPSTPTNPTTDKPVVPYVDGYIPVGPDGVTPLDPVDPADSSKGYVPPTPDKVSVDTYIPYVKAGSVVINYKDTDGNVLQAPVVDEDKVLVGTGYDTTDEDNKPTTITTADGKFVLIPSRTEGKEKGDVTDGVTNVTYIYQKVANWIPQIPGVPADQLPKTEYPFDPNKPKDPIPGIPTNPTTDKPVVPHVDGFTPYDPVTNTPLPPVDSNDLTKGYIPPKVTDPSKDTLIPYVKDTGSVIIKYIDTEGNTLQEPVVDEDNAPVGTTYDTKDEGNKPTEIVTKNGSKYVLVPAKTEGVENGTVTKAGTTVTYVYQKVANWIPEIPGVPAEDRPEIPYPFDPTTPDVPVTPTPATVIPNVPGYIPVEPDGVTPLKPIDPADPSKGYIPPTPENPGVDTPIPYVPVKVGSVVINYKDTDGNVIKAPVTDENNVPVGTDYVTSDEGDKPTTITTTDGTKYVLVPSKTEGAEIGSVTEAGITVTYVYQKVANWIPEIPGVPAEDRPEIPYPFDPTTPDVPVTPTPATVIPNVPGYIPVEPDGVTPLKPVDPADPSKGYVPPTPENPGVDTPIPYVPVKVGSVVINYKDTDGNVIKAPVTDENNVPVGTDYVTSDEGDKPTTITTTDGTKYVLVPSKTEGAETGSVTEAGTTVTYVYQKVANWIPEIPGVPAEDRPEIPYLFDPTTPDVPVTPTPATVIPNVPGYIPVEPDGVTPLKPVDPADPSKGYIPPTPENPGVDTPIPYVPVKVGSVVINYKDTDGNVIKAPVTDENNVPVGTDYVTSDEGDKPTTITTTDGTKYVLVPSKTEGAETGSVTEAGTTVTYVYQKVANWIPEIPGVPAEDRPEIPYPFDPTTPDVPVTPTPATVIPNVPGYIPVEPDGVTPLKPVDPADPSKGYIPPTPENPGVDTPIPYVPVKVGSVVINYKDTDGNVIKAPVTDENNVPVGTDYVTSDEGDKPTTITTTDGTKYVLVPSKTEGAETGSVTEAGTTVTYVYQKVANWIPEIPGVPAEDRPEIPYPFDPTTPDVPVTPTPGTVIPNVPGYIPVGPDGVTPLTPVDPEDPSKGYIPPTPENPGVDTPIPYVPVKVGSVVINYKDTDGNVIKAPVTDENNVPVGTSYVTSDEGDKPTTITTTDGTKYVLVESKTEGAETGKVTEKGTTVTYVYQKVANWIPNIPGVPTSDYPEIPYPFDPTNPDVPVTPTPGTVIPNVPGYIPVGPDGVTPLTPVDPEDPSKGYIPPTPENPGVDTPIPYVPVKVGSVVINYKDTDGNVIKAPVTDENNVPVGTSYVTSDEGDKPTTITTTDGTKYVLVESKTEGAETGKVTEEGTTVTYVYQKVANWIPEIPGVPAEDRPEIPYPFDPTNPDVPVTPTPGTVIPNVPGYIPVGPDGVTPLTPVDPEDPSKGYIPPTPENPGVDTPIPYVPVASKKVVTDFKDVDGNVISPREDGTTPNKSITGYEYVTTVVDGDGNTVHIYRKVPQTPTTPETPEPGRPGTPVPSAPAKPGQPATPKAGKAQLPNTGESSSVIGAFGTAMLVAALALVGKRRRKED